MLLMLPLTQLSSRVVNTYSCLVSLHLPLPQQAGHLPGGLTEAGSCLLSVEFLLVYYSKCKCQVAAQPPFTMNSEHSLFHQGGRLVTTPLTGEFWCIRVREQTPRQPPSSQRQAPTDSLGLCYLQASSLCL